MQPKVFIRVEEYKQIVELLTALKDKIAASKVLLEKLSELKAQEDAQIAAWSKTLAEVEDRLKSVESALT